MSIPTQAEYERREAELFGKQLRATETVPLAERKEARAEFKTAMQENPAIVAERIAWLLNGSYGYGSYKAALETIQNKRRNRAAWLNQTIAALEWNCPPSFAASAWSELTKAQQVKITALIQAEIESALENIAGES